MSKLDKEFMTKSKLLFTPGPLTTSESVKAAMLRDLGSRDREFLQVVRSIRERLLAIGGATSGDYECVLMQGSGTFAIESVISSAVPENGRLLVLVNGAYGRRIVQMAEIHGIQVDVLETPENRKISAEAVERHLSGSTKVTHVAVVHCETTIGIVNPVQEIGAVMARVGAVYIVDAMSSFGAIPVDLAAAHADFLIRQPTNASKAFPASASFSPVAKLSWRPKVMRERLVWTFTLSGLAWSVMDSSGSLHPRTRFWLSIRLSQK